MDEHFEGPIDSKQRARIVASLDRMVVSGRLTKEEADRLCGADKPERFDSAIRGIRVRHARAKLPAAIEDGSLSQDDADVILNRLRSGIHPLRSEHTFARFTATSSDICIIGPSRCRGSSLRSSVAFVNSAFALQS